MPSPLWTSVPGDSLVTNNGYIWTSVPGDSLVTTNGAAGPLPDVILGIANGYDGSTLTTLVDTRPRIAVVFEVGETLDVDLGTTTRIEFQTVFGVGEESTVDFRVYAAIEAVFDSGEGTYVDLNTRPATLLEPKVGTGEELGVDVSVEATFGFDVLNGEELDVDLAIRPAANIEIDVEVGEELEISLLSSTLLGVAYASGEAFEAEMDRYSPDLSLLVYHGEGFEEFQGSFGLNIGAVGFIHGEEASVDALDEQEFFRFIHGEEAEFSLSTETTISPELADGIALGIDLADGPSEPIGVFDFYEGSAGLGKISALTAIPISVTFYNSYMTSAGFQASTDFDLSDSCCFPQKPGKKDSHDIELDEAEFSGQTFDGDKIKFEIDLQARPRFKFDFFSGERSSLKDMNPFIDRVVFDHGERMEFNLESVIDFRLCPGNFIPNGDNIYVELEYEYPDGCYADYIYHGSTLSFGVLKTFPNPQVKFYDGADMVFNLTYDTPWAFQAHHGERLEWWYLDFRGFQEGQSVVFDFYEPPILGFHGESMECSLTIKYEVKLLEEGCFDNEYVWMTENGDPDPKKFNPVPVELDPFQHDILGICY